MVTLRKNNSFWFFFFNNSSTNNTLVTTMLFHVVVNYPVYKHNATVSLIVGARPGYDHRVRVRH